MIRKKREISEKTEEGQLKAIPFVNKELIRLYWVIGKIIFRFQEGSGRGRKFIDKITKDLPNAFPGIEGFSRTNILRMRVFYVEYKIFPPAVGQFI